MVDPYEIAHVYGRCRADVCTCNKACYDEGAPWMGTACPNWQPTGAESYDDLLKTARARKAENDARLKGK